MPDEASASRGAERILAAAVRLIGEHGTASTSLKAIAVEAGVSPALIIHHFGSKDGLRRACDVHVAQLIRTHKSAVLDRGPQLDPLAGLRLMEDSRIYLHYVARSLTEGGEHAQKFIDEVVADAEDYTARGVEMGIIKPTATPRERVVVLTLWSLGLLVLNQHLHRLLGVDLLAEDLTPQGYAPYLGPAMEIFTEGLFEEGVYEAFAAQFGLAPSGGAGGADPSDQTDHTGQTNPNSPTS